MNKIKTNPLCAFLIGALTATWVLILVYCFALAPNTVNESTVSSDTTESETKSYNTTIKDWKVKTDSGEEFTFHTPDGYYSLSDQYLDEMYSYYGAQLESDSIIVIGDSTDTTSVSNYINANTLSDVSNMLEQLYGDEYSEDEMVVSEALHYMQNGELPTELPLNYTINEIKTFDVNDTIFHVYSVAYDIEYVIESDDESTEASTYTQHVEQVLCYSETEDPIEIVVTQTVFDEDEAIELLTEFLGL